jgi:hypothetical protein
MLSSVIVRLHGAMPASRSSRSRGATTCTIR